MPEFQYNQQKSDSNLHKHGLSFPDAEEMWNGRTFEVPIKNSVKLYGEMRYMALGEIDARPLAAVISYRGGSIRLISVRESNVKERELYADLVKKAKQAC